GAAGEDGQRVGDESGAEDDAHLREPGHRGLSGDLLGEQSADGVTGGDAGSGEQLGGDEFGLFADVAGHRCLVFMWFRGGRSPACAARWAETGGPVVWACGQQLWVCAASGHAVVHQPNLSCMHLGYKMWLSAEWLVQGRAQIWKRPRFLICAPP